MGLYLSSISNHNQEYIKAIEAIQTPFLDNYDHTKKILLICEEFGDVTNPYVFYNLFSILEEIYLIFQNPSKENIEKRVKLIEHNFLVAQNYAIVIGITGVLRYLKNKTPSLDNKILKHEKRLEEILEKHNLLVKDTNHRKKKLREVTKDEKGIWHSPYANNKLKNLLKTTIEITSLPWNIYEAWGLKKSVKKAKPLKSAFVSTFSILMNTRYALARLVLFDMLRRRGSHYHFAVTELRDAVDHIAKCLISEDGDYESECAHAFEHIRRAAVESTHLYCKERLSEIKTILLNKKLPLPSGNLKILSEINKNISLARYLKGGIGWCQSILKFYEALELIEKVERT